MNKKWLVVLTIAFIVFAFSGNKNKEVIYTDKAPKPIGPYSQAIRSGGSLFVSGQIALRLDGSMDTSSIENECHLVLNNIKKARKFKVFIPMTRSLFSFTFFLTCVSFTFF